MRSNNDFIEVTGKINNKKFLINKTNIIYVTNPEDNSDDQAVIMVKDGDRSMRIISKESYKDITEELLWEPREWPVGQIPDPRFSSHLKELTEWLERGKGAVE